jgi:hypothetical protein
MQKCRVISVMCQIFKGFSNVWAESGTKRPTVDGPSVFFE